MSEGKYPKRLLTIGGRHYVGVSHEELDHLVGRLLQICDLTGDTKQREALKSEIKHRCRDWLDYQYEMAGYDKFGEVQYAKEPEDLPQIIR